MGKRPHSTPGVIDHFDLKPGRLLARKYEVIQPLGTGWEGEVFLVRELPRGSKERSSFFIHIVI